MSAFGRSLSASAMHLNAWWKASRRRLSLHRSHRSPKHAAFAHDRYWDTADAAYCRDAERADFRRVSVATVLAGLSMTATPRAAAEGRREGDQRTRRSRAHVLVAASYMSSSCALWMRTRASMDPITLWASRTRYLSASSARSPLASRASSRA